MRGEGGRRAEVVTLSTKRWARALASVVAVALASLAGTGVASASHREIHAPYVVGGKAAAPEAWPWATVLLDWDPATRTGSPFCGGSLVAPSWVLTAAHCLADAEPADVPVVVGKPNGRSGLGEWNQAVEFVKHPQYDPTTSRHDLALVRLARPSSQPPVAMASASQEALAAPRTVATLVGWGVSDASRAPARLPDTLQQGQFSILTASSCAATFGDDFDAATQLCASAPAASACFGDSGGPLMVPEGTRWVQVGVVSYGSSTCRAGPTVYTRVSALWSWVRDRIAPGAPLPSRIAGSDRFATAAAVSRSRFAPGVPVAYVATGDNFPDALAAGPAAAAAGGPILLTGRTSLPEATADELRRLRPKQVVVLGGPTVVADGVVKALAGTGAKVARRGGPDRYATAAATSAATFSPGVPVAYVAVGNDFPDALSAAAAAGARRSPLLLVTPDAVPAAVTAELDRLRPASVVVVSTADAVSAAVEAQLGASGVPVRRVSGADRYATAAAVSADAFSASEEVFVATGLSFPDALAAGVAAATAKAPLLLVPGSCVPAPVRAEVVRLSPKRLTVLGGAAAVAPAVEDLTAC